MSTLPTAVRRHLAAFRALLVFTVLLGLAYPLAVTGIAQVAFPGRANGSLVEQDDRVVGSGLIGQPFVDGRGDPLPRWFQSRPSAALDPSNGSDPGYNPGFSQPSNKGPSNPDLITLIEQRRAAVAAFEGVPPDRVPADAITASASGLDPHISPEYAYLQVNRVAAARKLDPAAVRALVDQQVQGPTLGFLGQARVNVVELNLALEQGAQGVR